MKLFLVLIGVLACFIAPTIAVKCYNCDSIGEYCRNVDRDTQLRDCDMCVRITANSIADASERLYSSLCASSSDICEQIHAGKHQITRNFKNFHCYTCTSDLCNSSGRVRISYSILFAIFIVFAIFLQ